MAVSHNAIGLFSTNGGPTLSGSFVVNPGDNLAALIGINWASPDAATLDTVTFAGQSGTFIHLAVSSTTVIAEQYYVAGFLAGLKALSVTWVGGIVAGIVGVEVMSDVNQTTPIGAKHTNTGNSTTPSTTVSGTLADSMVVDTLTFDNSIAPIASGTVDPSQTERYNQVAVDDFASPTIRIRGTGSTEPSAGGSVIMSWTLSRIKSWAICAVEFLAAAATDKPVNVSTSYHYGADPLPLESFKDPAVQQRIWVNDRRYMQGDS